jgi:hypothetical protein
MIISEEPTHSLGGYFYQKHRSPTWRNEKKQKFFAGYDDTKTIKEQIFLSLYPNKKKSAIASGATPIGSAGRPPDKITDYNSYEAGVEVHYRIPWQKKNYRH